MNSQKIIFSGIQPSGHLHLGNYLGAISQWITLQDEYRCIFSIVNYHAITVLQDREELKKKTIEVAKIYLASGIDSKKSIIFCQSDVTAHVELAWILNCTSARVSDLNKMTQYKDKSKKKEENVSVGLFDYPVLMASDILLYNTDVVPVGEDQTQHVELCRTLAKRFNNQYGAVFKMPEVKIRKEGARIMALDDPTKKMSKSADSINSYIGLLDDPELAKKKIMKAVTDSGSDVIYDPEKKPAVSNLIIMYSLLTNMGIKDIGKKYKGQGYGVFKKDLAEIVAEFLTDFQKKYNSISDQEVAEILGQGAEQASSIAGETLRKVKERVGII
jgi:tryptophanyl-tRNA synthetase